LERRAEGLERTEQSVRDRTAHLDQREAEIEREADRARTELERVAALTAEQARQELLDRLDAELRDEAARRVRAMESSAKAEADARSGKVLAAVMQRMTSEVTA